MLSLRQAIRRSAVIRPVAVSRTYASAPNMNDGDPQRIEKLKERNVKGETNSKIPEHAPGWSESLSSQSEAGVKAEKSDKGPEQLQSETSQMHEEEHPEGKSDPKPHNPKTP